MQTLFAHQALFAISGVDLDGITFVLRAIWIGSYPADELGREVTAEGTLANHSKAPIRAGFFILFRCIVVSMPSLASMVHSFDLEEKMLPVQVRDFYGDSFLIELR